MKKGLPDSGVLRSGWGDKPCNCDDKLEFSNCGKLIRALSSSNAASGALSAGLAGNRSHPVEVIEEEAGRSPNKASGDQSHDQASGGYE